MIVHGYVVSFYAKGSRRAGDCYPDFLPTRSSAIDAGQRYLELARSDASLAWIHRFTVKRISWSDRD